MGLYANYRKIYDVILSIERESKVTLTPALRREIFDLYADKVIKPFMTPKETIEFIELHPRKLNRPPRPLPRFTKEEQAARKKKSAAINKVQRDYILDQAQLIHSCFMVKEEKVRDFDRDLQQLFIVPKPGTPKDKLAEIREFNDDVAFLFNSKEDWSQFTDEENKIFARRRSEIMLKRLKDNLETIQNISTLMDESLPTETLVQNYRTAISACNLYNCIEAYCDEATASFEGQENYYDFTQEEMKLLYETYRPLIGEASVYQNQVMLMANPVYEYLDISALEDYDADVKSEGFNKNLGLFDLVEEAELEAAPDAIKKFYQKMEARGHVENREKMKELGKEIQDEFFERHSNNKDAKKNFTPDQTQAMVKFFRLLNKKRITDQLHDSIDDFLTDYEFMYHTSYFDTMEKFNKTKEDHLFAKDASVKFYSERNTPDGLMFIENADVIRLYEGIPVAMEKNDRVIILTPEKGKKFGGATEDTPEALFNYGLKSQQTVYTQRLKDADPLLVISSPEYKEMQKALKDIGKLQELASGQSTAQAYRKFQKLLNASEIYLRHKKNGITDDDNRSSVEQKRVDAARDVRKYALAKLKELELVNQARNTLQKYKDMEPEARKAAIAAEDALAEKLRQQAAADKAAKQLLEEQEAAPLDFFEKQMRAPKRQAALPKELQEAVATQLKTLKKELVKDTDAKSLQLYKDFSVYQALLPTQLARTLGGMIAAELVLQEQKELNTGVAGPLESFFAVNKEKDAENSSYGQALEYLGKEALQKLLPEKDFEHMAQPGAVSLSEREVKHILENFHSAEYAAPGRAKDFAAQHIYAVPSEGFEFEKDYNGLIPDSLEQSIRKLTGFYPEKPDKTAAVRHLAGSVVAAEMISRERELFFDGKPGAVEKELMQNNEAIQKLGEQAIQLCREEAAGAAGKEIAADAALFRLDAQKLDQLAAGFRKEHGLISPLESSLTEQYCSSVKPRRGERLDDYEQVLVGYAKMQILDPLRKYGTEPDMISAEDSRKILSSCTLCNMVLMERAKGGNEPGMMESLLLKEPERFEEIRHNIEASPDFNKLISSRLTPHGMPIDSLTYMTSFLKDTGLVVNIIDNTKEALHKNQPEPEKAKEKTQNKVQEKTDNKVQEKASEKKAAKKSGSVLQ